MWKSSRKPTDAEKASALRRGKAFLDGMTAEDDAAYTAAALADPDNPPADALFKRARGRPRAAEKKVPVLLKLDPDLVEKLRASGRGWQTRVNETLRKAVGL